MVRNKFVTLGDLNKLNISNEDVLFMFQIQATMCLSDVSVEETVNTFFDEHKITVNIEDISTILSESNFEMFKNILNSINYNRVVNFERIAILIIKSHYDKNDEIVEELALKIFRKYIKFMENDTYNDNISMIPQRFIVMDSIMKYIFKNPMKKLSVFTRGYLPSLITYIAFIKKIQIRATSNTVNAMNMSINDLRGTFLYTITNHSDKVLAQFDDEIKKYLKKFGLTNNKSYEFSEIIEIITLKNLRMKEDYTKYIEKHDKNVMELNSNNLNLTDSVLVEKFGVMGRYIGINEGFMKSLNIISIDELNNYKFSKKEISIIALNYIFTEKFNAIDESHIYQLFISSLYTYVITKNYQNLKKKYLSLSKLNTLEKYNTMDNEISKQKKDLAELEWKKSRIEIKHEEEKQELNNEITKLKNLLKEKQDITEEYEDLKREVVKLREVFFNESQKEKNKENSELASLDYEGEFTKYLLNNNIAFVGLNNFLTESLKTKFKDILIVNDDRLNTDFSFMQNLDFIYINTSMSHSLYFKLMKFIKKYNLKYMYIKDVQNLNMFFENMYNVRKN